MNSDPNSDLKQYTESKLGRVHRVHTQVTQAALKLHALGAVSWRTGCRIVAPFGLVARRVVALRSRYKICIATQFPTVRIARCVTRAAECVAVLLRRVVGILAPCSSPCPDTKAAPPPRYKTLYCDTSSGQAPRACAFTRPARRPVVS